MCLTKRSAIRTSARSEYYERSYFFLVVCIPVSELGALVLILRALVNGSAKLSVMGTSARPVYYERS